MNKHILLTGGMGFSGAHFVEHVLRETDNTITIIDRLNYAGNMNRLADMERWKKECGRVNFVYHDFRAPFVGNVLERALAIHPSYIFHYGAETHVDRSIITPILFAMSNVIGTMNMLDLAREAKPQRFMQISTDEVYGPVKVGYLHKEGEPHNPSNPYSASKSGAEAFCKAYVKTYSVPVIISNTMNMFGERQEVEKFIPKTIRAIYNDEPVTIHCKMENGEITGISSRCWLHARNQANGVLFLAENGNVGESYNVVGEWATAETIAKMIAGFMGKDIKIQYEDVHSTRPYHDLHYGLDGTKMKLMGWVPPYSLAESLEKTVKWTLDNRSWL
jgi:dTDP-glucose 4,6-dehydratase